MKLIYEESKFKRIFSLITFIASCLIVCYIAIEDAIESCSNEEDSNGIIASDNYTENEFQAEEALAKEEPQIIEVSEHPAASKVVTSPNSKKKLILKHGRWTKGEGIIIKVLPDDTNPPCHQRLLLKISDDRTLLITHNVDLAPRVENPQRGDLISFYGEFIDNEKGGLIHWTHHDPNGGRGGYIIHNSIRYE